MKQQLGIYKNTGVFFKRLVTRIQKNICIFVTHK